VNNNNELYLFDMINLKVIFDYRFVDIEKVLVFKGNSEFTVLFKNNCLFTFVLDSSFNLFVKFNFDNFDLKNLKSCFYLNNGVLAFLGSKFF
jgi:hypothetical protein